jgi:hypothetical protein
MYRKTQLFEFEWERCPDGYTVKSEVITNKIYEELMAEYERKCNVFPRGVIPIKPRKEDIRPHKELIRHIYPKTNNRETYRLSFKQDQILQDLANIGNGNMIMDFAAVENFVNQYGLLFDRKIDPYEDLIEWDNTVNFIKNIFENRNKPIWQSNVYQIFNKKVPHLIFKPQIQAGDSPMFNFISLIPQNLFSATCLQLINQLTAGIDLVPCQARGCNNRYPRTRKDKKTCQPSCKKRLARDNKKQNL